MSSSDDFLQLACALTGAQRAEITQEVQSLWSGYGSIIRVRLHDISASRAEGRKALGSRLAIIKHVEPPQRQLHPRGWQGSRSNARKLRSYSVEHAFYQNFANKCDEACRVAQPLALFEQNFFKSEPLLIEEQLPSRWLFVMEDLNDSGFPRRRSQLSGDELDACLKWLAHFHSRFMGQASDGLWPVGSYWHLHTRPDELEALDPNSHEAAQLKEAAPLLDAQLNQARFQTLIHGDAKVANFCFAKNSASPQVAAVDFQYVGGGCGMKDLAYFFSSCLDENECAKHVPRLLDNYFQHLRKALKLDAAQQKIAIDADALEQEWRALYPAAWADFIRFLLGWAPEHYKIHDYSRAMSQAALKQL